MKALGDGKGGRLSIRINFLMLLWSSRVFRTTVRHFSQNNWGFTVIKFFSMFEIIRRRPQSRWQKLPSTLCLFFHAHRPGAPHLHTHFGRAANGRRAPPPQYNGCPGIQLWQRCLTRGAVPYIMTCRCPAPPPPLSRRAKGAAVFHRAPWRYEGPSLRGLCRVLLPTLLLCLCLCFVLVFVSRWLCGLATLCCILPWGHGGFTYEWLRTFFLLYTDRHFGIWCGWISNDISSWQYNLTYTNFDIMWFWGVRHQIMFTQKPVVSWSFK